MRPRKKCRAPLGHLKCSFYVLMMPSRSRLVFLALCVLEDAFDASREGAVPPTASLRLALGFLYAVSKDGADAQPEATYAQFWREATKRSTVGNAATDFGRAQALNSCLNGIARAAGMERDVLFLKASLRFRRASLGKLEGWE